MKNEESKIKLSFLILIFFLGILLSASCSSLPSSGSTNIVLWTGMSEKEAIKSIAKEFSALQGVKVEVIQVPFVDLQIKYQIAAPALAGPDLIIGPHDWVGPFVITGLIQPVDDLLTGKERESFLPISLESLSYQGRLYGLPISVEGLALIYNKDMLVEAPRSFEDVINISQQWRQKGQYGLVFDINNLYFAWPFFSGWEAYPFLKKDGAFDSKQLGLDKPEAIKAVQFLKDLVWKYKMFPSSITGDVASSLFLEGKAAMIINGPWFLTEIHKVNLNYGVIPIPRLPNGNYPRPFVGVQGIMLNARARNSQVAREFMCYMLKKENLLKIYQESGRIPARKSALEEVACRADIKGFAQSISRGEMMPNIPPMTQVWPYMQQSLQLITSGEVVPSLALKIYTEKIKQAIEVMTE